MHVALLIYGSLDTLSGGYLYDRKLVDYLRQQGDTVEILSLPWRSYPRHLMDNFSPALLRRLQNLQVDVLLQDELNHPSLFWLNRRLRVNYPIVSIVHHLRSSEARPGWQNAFYRPVERAYLQSVDGFIFNSQTTRGVVENLLAGNAAERKPERRSAGLILRHNGLLEPKSVVAFPAADHRPIQISSAEIEQRARQPGPLRLLFVGNIIPRKGLHVLLDALALLPADAANLSVVGSGDVEPGYTREVLRQVEFLGLAERVSFKGALSDAALEAEFSRSQVLAVPSSYEGFGIVYLEAMGYGLPVIATTSGAAGELINPGENGQLIVPGDAPGMANHLRGWHENRGQLALNSLAAHSQFRKHPDWNSSGMLIHSFLHKKLKSLP
jgi:glycosyltransferase involved in cell wall biosynthesis